MEENKIEEYKKKKFIIAVILACVSFIFNIICVVNTQAPTGPGSSRWGNLDFYLFPSNLLFYWLKTISAAIGLFYFFRSGVFTTQKVPRYLSIFTLIILWYSIPVVNFIFLYIFAILLRGIRGYNFEYKDRIILQFIWLISVFLLLLFFDLSMRLIKIIKGKNTSGC